MKLTLQNASTIVDKALAKAREAKYRPMCVAVLDDGGNLKALKREDGASILRPTIAVGKAWGAVGMGESSRQLSERLKERPAFLGALSDMSGGEDKAENIQHRDGDTAPSSFARGAARSACCAGAAASHVILYESGRPL